jgi:RNA polymerase sigma-70 factor, ECF subfamily
VLYRVARRLTLDSAAAEDLVSGTLLAACRGWPEFDGRHLRSWLIRILKNQFLAQKRYDSSRPSTVPIEGGPEPAQEGPWNEIDSRQISYRIIEELDRIPEEFRMAVALCDVDEMSYAEAAEALGVPVGTVRSRLFRGRRLLRSRLAALAPEGMEEGR